MKLKKLVALVSSAILAFSLVGCSIEGEENGASSNESLVGNGSIGFSVSTLNNPFFVTLSQGAKDKAKEEGIPEETTLLAYQLQKDVESDKDEDGETIPLSASRNKVKALGQITSKLSDDQTHLLYEMFQVSEKVWNDEKRTKKKRSRCRRSSPAASSSEWRSPAPWPPRRRLSCSMSPPRRSTRR